MFLILLFALPLVIFDHGIETSLAKPSCDQNSTWSCQIESCTGTCYGIPVKQCMGSSTKCVEGCHCKDFYVRDKLTGKCVQPKDCTCPKNQSVQYSNSCFQKCQATVCPQYLIQRCFCDRGLCTNSQSECVPRKPRRRR